MRRAFAGLLAILLLTPAVANAYDLRVGYQLGASQTIGTTVAPTVVIAPGQPVATAAGQAQGGQIVGFQLTTALTAALSFDVLTNALDHGFIVGGSISQLIVPTGSSQRTNIFQGNLAYQTRYERPLWGAAFGANYVVTSNGRSCSASNGAVDAICPQPAVNNQAGTYIITGLAHQVNAIGQLQFTRLRWDLNLQASYNFSENAAYSLAPGVGSQQMVTTGGTNLGGFLRVRSHAATPTAVFRTRVGRSGVFSAGAISTYTLQLLPDDTSVTTGTVTAIVPAQPAVPTTWVNSALITYTHALTLDRAIGAEASASYNFRVATDPNTQEPFAHKQPTPDTAIGEFLLTYSDFWPWDVRFNATAGAALPWLFQPPPGQPVPFNMPYKTVRADPEPVFSASLARFFDPVDATLAASRGLIVGAFGVSAVINEQISLDLSYSPEVMKRVAFVHVGFNLNQTHGVGGNLLQRGAPLCDPSGASAALCTPEQLLILSFNNRGFGANLSAGWPVFVSGDFAGVLSGTYNLNWLDPDPKNVVSEETFVTHTGLLQFAVTWGRGPIAKSGVGYRESDELDAFSQDPRNGSPLITSKLMTEGAPMLDATSGKKPGLPPEERRDSKQAYQQQRRQQEADAAARKQAGAVQGTSTAEDEDAEHEAAEKAEEERAKRKKKRTRKFSEWPTDQSIPSTQTSTRTGSPQ